MNATPVFAETPNVAAPNAGLGGGFKPIKVKPLTEEFKTKLLNCIEGEQALFAQTLIGGCNTNDNSMVINSKPQETGVAGILEGFGLLDYQADIPAVPEDEMIALQKMAQHIEQANAENIPQQWTQQNGDTVENGMSEQFAWMLQNKQFDMLPPDIQQLLSKAKGYFGSFESTNNEKSAKQGISVLSGAEKAEGPQNMILRAMVKENPKQDAAPSSFNAPQKTLNSRYAGRDGINANGLADSSSDAKEVPQKAVLPQTEDSAVSDAQQTRRQYPKKADSSNPADFGDGKTKALDFNYAETAANEIQSADAKTGFVEANTQKTVPLSHDFVKDNVANIVDKIRTQFENAKHEFDVELKPEFLGKLNIKLSMENGSIRMVIKAGDSSVKGILCEQLPSLQNRLEDKGITLTSIDIVYQSSAHLGGGFEARRQNEQHGGTNKAGKGKALDWDAKISLYDAAAETADCYLNGSTVVYLA